MKPSFFIDKENLELGIVNSSVAIIQGINIPTTYTDELNYLRQEALEKVLSYSSDKIKENPVLEGYRDIYRKLGRSTKKIKPAAEGFIELIKRRKIIPKINVAVDAYNIIVLDTFVGIGVHDLDIIDGNIRFTRAIGSEAFTPLGRNKSKILPTGDFLYRDESKVLAWMASSDCDQAKIMPHTKNLLLVIEGNINTPLHYTNNAIKNACEQIIKFCGGTYTTMEILTLEI